MNCVRALGVAIHLMERFAKQTSRIHGARFAEQTARIHETEFQFMEEAQADENSSLPSFD